MTSSGNHWGQVGGWISTGGQGLNPWAGPVPATMGRGRKWEQSMEWSMLIFCASKGPGLGSWETKVLVLILPLSSCVALGDTFSEPQFSEL